MKSQIQEYMARNGAKGGKKRWDKVSPEERSKILSELSIMAVKAKKAKKLAKMSTAPLQP